MNVIVFGMGYVGTVCAACLLRDGHHVVGVDPIASKIKDLNSGKSPISEPLVAEILSDANRRQRFRATNAAPDSVSTADMVWICVGTPSNLDGGVDFSAVERSLQEVGACLRHACRPPLIVIRSTLLPGTTRQRLIPKLEEFSGRTCGEDFHIVYHPEFLREGTAVSDFDQPSKIVIGEASLNSAAPLVSIYKNIKAPFFQLTLEEAEMAKYYDNIFHAVKVTFANEIGAIAHSLGIDARRVADVFCADTKLNISTSYLRPGFAFGGSCLPKDLRAINRLSQLIYLSTPMISSILESNNSQVERLVDRILAHNSSLVGFVGLAFKCGTDDMRESPFVTAAKRLLGEGIQLLIYDPAVDPSRLTGSNKKSVEKNLGHLEPLLVTTLDDLAECDIIIINHPVVNAAQLGSWIDGGVKVIDLCGVTGIGQRSPGYEGVLW